MLKHYLLVLKYIGIPKHKPNVQQRALKVLVNYAGFLEDNGMLFDTNRAILARDYNMINPQREAQNGYAPIAMSCTVKMRS